MSVRIEKPTDIETGLMPKEVITSEKNVIIDEVSKSYKSIFLEHIFTLFNIINFILAGLVIYTGSYRNMLFMGTVLFNLAIGLFQEIRAKQVLDKLALISQPRAEVLRAGKIQEIPVDEVVRNDILIVRTGNQICCDCVLVEGSLEVNESMLTGESTPIRKTPGEEVLSGTFVVSGQAKVQAVKVGTETYAYSILKQARRQKRYPSQLRDSIQSIIKFCTIVLIPAGILLFAKQYYISRDLNDAILNMVAAVVGMIPEGLVFLTSIALAVSSTKLARQKVLVQELYCIETLARVDTLCLDKTGTITEGTMKVTDLETFNGYTRDQVIKILANVYHALPDTNATAQAIREFAPFYNLDEASQIFPFSSSRKYAAVLFDTTLYMCGAYTYIVPDPDPAILHRIEQLAEKGIRVVALVKRSEENGSQEPVLLSLISIEDCLRPDAKKILDYFYRQGVDIKIISGDDPRTVAAIARNAGVAGSWIDMSGIQSGEEMEQALRNNSVFGRVSPEQKQEMVETLEKMGHVVAMTGDGVNDVMALKSADCSIAMGSGSQAARSVASLVLLKDQFDALPDILNEGRCVINNIQRTASLFLVKTMFSLGLSLLTLAWLSQYPFQPIQLTLISSICTGIPSFILTLEPNPSRVRGDFLINVFSKALPGALNVILMVVVVNAVSYWLPMSDNQFSTICTILAGINALFVLRSVCQPMSSLRHALVITMSVLFAVCILLYPKVFLMVDLNWMLWLYTGIHALFIPLSYDYLRTLNWKKMLMKMHILE